MFHIAGAFFQRVKNKPFFCAVPVRQSNNDLLKLNTFFRISGKHCQSFPPVKTDSDDSVPENENRTFNTFQTLDFLNLRLRQCAK